MSKEEREKLIDDILNNIKKINDLKKGKQGVTPAPPSKSDSR